jgi:hypothetical protein
VVFQSENGIWQLTRGLVTDYIGKNVSDYNHLTIASSVLLPEDNQVRFVTSDQCLVYDFVLGQWTTFSNYSAKSATNWDGTFVLLRDNGRIYREDPSNYTDAGTAFSMRIVSAWFRSQIQSTFRVWNLSVLGEKVSNHILKIKVYRNYNDYTFEQKLFKVNDNLDVSSWGTGTGVWGEGTVWGSVADEVYQFEVKPEYQRCQSLKVEMEDITDPSGSVGNGPAYSLSALSLSLGVTSRLTQESKSATDS